MCFMWELKDISWSKMTARFLMVVLEARVMPSRVAISLDDVFLRCLGPSTITSVLSEFSSRKLQVIQVLMSLRHAWRLRLTYPVCGFLVMLINLAIEIAPLTLVVMALERYVAVRYPLRHATIITIRNTGMAIIVVWAFSSLKWKLFPVFLQHLGPHCLLLSQAVVAVHIQYRGPFFSEDRGSDLPFMHN